MGKSDAKAQPQKDEFSKIFDDYRAKIEEISRKTSKSFPNADSASDKNAGGEADNMEVMVSRDQPRLNGGRAEVISPADLEAEDIIQAAKKRAQQIIHEAEEKSKKEAKKRTQSEVDKIIAKSRKDALEIITQTKQAAEKERNEIIVASKNEAEQLIKEITEKCRQETQAQSSRAIEEAREKADKITSDIVSSSKEISEKVNEIITRTKQMVEEFEGKIQTETGELVQTIKATQQQFEQFFQATRKEDENKEAPANNNNKEPINTPALGLRVLGEKSNGNNGSHTLFSGQVEMRSISTPFDYQYLKNLKKYLIHIPNIKYVQESASEKEMSIVFDLKEPLPLLDIIKNIPLVDEVTTEAGNISIIFRNSA
jgi:F0F1-type ATP synthase membrane subunit b/b'